MKVVALAGGVGGAKLADGLAQILPFEDLTIIVNTGDDFKYLGLNISPDLDTVCYTLAGLENPETGWGCKNDTFHALENIQLLGGESWFRIGDKDLATHLERTQRLFKGIPLSQVTKDFCRSWGIKQFVTPMSDQPVHTVVDTTEYGELDFQEYFVHQKCIPKVKGFRFEGIESARPAPSVLESIKSSDAVIICPSNPWVSIDPILAFREIRASLLAKTVVAVSPLIGGQTVKGPASKMFLEMGIEPSAAAVANHYGNILTGYVIDRVDENLAHEFSIPCLITNTLMKNREDRCCLAQDVLNFI